jgi:peptidoglycan biosynthesis protein MviN/MurJ (putative lipid II flippase)
LPLLLPLLGRSLASTAGEGALTTFNYAWKLVELPLVLAIQLVATLAFPGIAAAFVAGDAALNPGRREQQVRALRGAFVLAWALACAAAAAIAGMAPALAQLLFGWGRMTPEAVAQVAAWGRIGAWSLPPQALLAVLLTLMASTGRLRGAVGAYLGALGLLLLLGALSYTRGQLDGAGVMWVLNAALTAAAVALLVRERDFLRGVLVFRDLLPALLAAVILAALATGLPTPPRLPGLGLAAGLALSVLLVAWGLSPGLREALRR